MARKKSHITITDQFCGAGGSSVGAQRAIKGHGGEITLALNHWKLAIETHNTNFPDTQHDCTDISAADPRRYPSTDILITSPECTNHSLAKGKKMVKAQMDMFDKRILDPSAERSRATMWDVPRFAEYHDYNIIIVENVVDARKWVMWEAWLLAMHALKYDHKCCYFNSMHFHPTPQSRDRMYVVFWKKGNNAPDLEFTPQAWCSTCGADVAAVQAWKKNRFGKYKTQYIFCCPTHSTEVAPYYYAAFNAIEWSDIGTRISDRPKPLSENTIRRIQYGLDKYCQDPFVIHAAYGSQARGVWRHITDPLFVQTTLPTQALVVPFIIKGEHTIQPGYVRSTIEALQTQTVRQSMSLVSPPFVPISRGESKAASITDPLKTQSQMINHGIVTTEAWNSFISYYYGNEQASHITEALGTMLTKDRACMVNYQKPTIDECFFRMIKPHEVQRAMAFDDSYVILGSGKDKVKQCGNAVTPPVMEWLVDRCVKSLN